MVLFSTDCVILFIPHTSITYFPLLYPLNWQLFDLVSFILFIWNDPWVYTFCVFFLHWHLNYILNTILFHFCSAPRSLTPTSLKEKVRKKKRVYTLIGDFHVSSKKGSCFGHFSVKKKNLFAGYKTASKHGLHDTDAKIFFIVTDQSCFSTFSDSRSLIWLQTQCDTKFYTKIHFFTDT